MCTYSQLKKIFKKSVQPPTPSQRLAEKISQNVLKVET